MAGQAPTLVVPLVLVREALFPVPGCSSGWVARVTVVSAPPGSGKTVLVRSWIGQARAAGSVAWVPAGDGDRDPQRFWLWVQAALRQTAAGSALVQPVTAAPDLDGWAITERLLTDLAPLDDRVWLVVDDVHELRGSLSVRDANSPSQARGSGRCTACSRTAASAPAPVHGPTAAVIWCRAAADRKRAADERPYGR